jgi:hypothetical protein
MFSEATLSDINIVLCYVLSLYRLHDFCLDFVQEFGLKDYVVYNFMLEVVT